MRRPRRGGKRKAVGICGATSKQTGKPCQRPAGWGTDFNVGHCKLHLGNTPDGRKYAQRLLAEQAASGFGIPIEVDADTALLAELHRCAGTIAWLATFIAEVAPEERLEGDRLAFVQLYERERDRLVRVASACIASGIAERHVQAIERSADSFASVLRNVLGELEVLDDPRAPTIVQRHLALLENPQGKEGRTDDTTE
jgi:hypothetical protein